VLRARLGGVSDPTLQFPSASFRLRGSVTLVALCFVAVLGIGLASYLAVTNQSMMLSNRSYVTGVSEQLAETGLEQALWSFNQNDWSSWTISGTTAKRTITFPSTKYGSSGLTTSINLRVDNYNAYNLSATWSSTTTYRINDLVGYNGSPYIWYRSVQNGNLNKNPSTQTDLAWWVPAPVPWVWSSNITYSQYDVVNYSGIWYRYSNAASSSGNLPTNTTYWTSIPTLSLSWNNATAYAVNAFVYSSGVWYRCTTAHTGHAPPNAAYWNPGSAAPYISWEWRSGISYLFNDLVYNSSGGMAGVGTWYRCTADHTSAGSGANGPPPAGSNWENALSGPMWAWSSSYSYNLGDVVYSGSSWYRCILAHTNQGPPNATYWSTAPLKSNAWDSGKQYNQYDTVSYNGVWYLSILNNNTNQNPVTATTYWVDPTNVSYQWNAATAYTTSSYVSYGGVWYDCISANTNITPNNATYWTALGAPVIYAEGTATLPNGSATIKTQLRARVAQAPLFPNAAAATTSLTLGAGGTVDSYDSTAGVYGGSNIGYSAVLAASGTTSPAVTVTSTTVKGYVAAPSASTTPYAPIWTYGGAAVLTGTASGIGVDLTRVSRSPYIPQFDTLPSGGLTAAFAASNFPKGTALTLSATTNLGTPGATTPSRYYYSGNLTLSGSSTTIININGPVILYINGDLTMDSGTPNGKININSTGSAEIHIAGRLTVNIGSDGINNITQDPKKLILICDTSASSVQNYSDGTSPVYGVIYMPNTTNSSGLSLDTSTTIQIYGAISAKKITYSGVDANLHYDTSLRYATFGGVEQPCIITEWRELTDPAERAALP